MVDETQARWETPIALTEQSWPEGTVPLVSIHCITYNHVRFIEEAIQGFLMQRTTFPVEIIVHDDASTDGTSQIVRRFADRYPNLFRPILHKENQWSQGIMPRTFTLPATHGKYIATCDGDDYWTDSLKLETQVGFLEAHPEYVLACHNTWRTWDDGSQPEGPAILQEKDELELRDFIDLDYFQKKNNLVLPAHTSSFVARRSVIPDQLPEWIGRCLSGDMCLFALIAAEGKIKYFRRCMSVRRKHEGSITNRSDVERNNAYLRFVATIKEIDKHFEGRFRGIQARKVEEHLERVVAYWVKEGAFLKALGHAKLAMNPTSGMRLVAHALRLEVRRVVRRARAAMYGSFGNGPS